MKESLLVGALIGAAVLLSGLWNKDSVTVNVPEPTVIQQSQDLGAISSPDISSPYLSFGNVRQWAAGSSFSTAGATSTLCSIQSPAATTTLVSATLRVASQPYAAEWEIYRAAVRATKTTLLAHGQGNSQIVATTTATSLTDGVVVPNSWLNFVVSTTTTVNANYLPTGKCSATFREI